MPGNCVDNATDGALCQSTYLERAVASTVLRAPLLENLHGPNSGRHLRSKTKTEGKQVVDIKSIISDRASGRRLLAAVKGLFVSPLMGFIWMQISAVNICK